MAGLGPGWANLAGGGSILLQIALYNLVGGILGAVTEPFVEHIRQGRWDADPARALSPPELAALVIRGELTEDQAAAQARLTGVDAERFHQLTRLAGQAPGPSDLAVALRRKLIDQATYDKGIAQGNIRTEWGPLFRQLAVQQPSPVAMLSAYLEGQLEEGPARELYAKLGGDPDYFDILYNTQGQAPTPVQLLDMLNRGAIGEGGTGPGEVSYTQGFLEGPWRNKWRAPMLSLRRYLPPPRTVTAMWREGSYSKAQAADRLKQNGLDPEDIAAYLTDGTSQATTTTKDLGQATITQLYRDRIVTRQQAGGFLQVLGYTGDQAEYILEVEDLRVVQSFLERAVGRVHTLYVGHKVTQAVAQSALADIGVPAGNIGDLLQLWGYERDANVVSLTAAQVGTAFKDEVISQADALVYLANLGYLPHDAWLYLCQHVHKRLPDEPPKGGSSPTGG